MEQIIANIVNVLGPDKPITDLVQYSRGIPAGSGIYTESVSLLKKSVLFIARDEDGKFLVEAAASKGDLSGDFAGEDTEEDGIYARRCALSRHNAQALRRHVNWTTPISLRDRRTTIGCGDRLGLATPGHLRAVRRYRVSPVLAQQSIRELTLTGRSYQDVVDDASFLVFQEGYSHGFGADGDHLKTLADIDVALAAGMPMITLDQTGVMNPAVATWSEAEIEAAYQGLSSETRDRIAKRFADQSFCFDGIAVRFPALEAKRCAVMYGPALDFTKEVYDHLKARRGDSFDLELSIDETTTPTLPTHHLFIATELLRRGVALNSLAPRFVGDFQKGIDYLGDQNEFAAQLKLHCAIARAYGNYKISIHSGSDKFSVFPAIGRLTRNRLHLKTAGTSWLEAVRCIAKVDAALYRDMHNACADGLPEALKLYHITADFDCVPRLDTLKDTELPSLLDRAEARQLLHISYGTILRNPELRAAIYEVLHRYEENYYGLLDKHFSHHLDTLGIEKR